MLNTFLILGMIVIAVSLFMSIVMQPDEYDGRAVSKRLTRWRLVALTITVGASAFTWAVFMLLLGDEGMPSQTFEIFAITMVTTAVFSFMSAWHQYVNIRDGWMAKVATAIAGLGGGTAVTLLVVVWAAY